jgi:hypothetical protein
VCKSIAAGHTLGINGKEDKTPVESLKNFIFAKERDRFVGLFLGCLECVHVDGILENFYNQKPIEWWFCIYQITGGWLWKD